MLLCVGTSVSFMLETSSRCPMHYGPHALDMHVKCMQGPSSGLGVRDSHIHSRTHE